MSIVLSAKCAMCKSSTGRSPCTWMVYILSCIVQPGQQAAVLKFPEQAIPSCGLIADGHYR